MTQHLKEYCVICRTSPVEHLRRLGNYGAPKRHLLETDVAFLNLEAGQIPELTAKWGKRSLSHSQGSLALTREQMAVCGNNKPVQEEKGRESQRTLRIRHNRSPSYADCLFTSSLRKKKKLWFKQGKRFGADFLVFLFKVASLWLFEHLVLQNTADTRTLSAPHFKVSRLNYKELQNDWMHSVAPLATVNTYELASALVSQCPDFFFLFILHRDI